MEWLLLKSMVGCRGKYCAMLFTVHEGLGINCEWFSVHGVGEIEEMEHKREQECFQDVDRGLRLLEDV